MDTTEPKPLRWASLLLWVAVAVVVGLLALFPDAISRLRQASAPYAAMPESCDLVQGPCTADFGDGTRVTLHATPGEAVSTEPVKLRFDIEGEAVPSMVELSGADMNMGLLRLPLRSVDTGWETTLVMPVCTTQRMKWNIDLLLDGRAAGFQLWSHR